MAVEGWMGLLHSAGRLLEFSNPTLWGFGERAMVHVVSMLLG